MPRSPPRNRPSPARHSSSRVPTDAELALLPAPARRFVREFVKLLPLARAFEEAIEAEGAAAAKWRKEAGSRMPSFNTLGHRRTLLAQADTIEARSRLATSAARVLLGRKLPPVPSAPDPEAERSRHRRSVRPVRWGG